jgi:hypothetical protein
VSTFSLLETGINDRQEVIYDRWKGRVFNQEKLGGKIMTGDYHDRITLPSDLTVASLLTAI